MRRTLIVAAITTGIAVASSPAAALANDAVERPPPTPLPAEIVNRPLTLPRGTLEVTLPLDFNLSSDRVGEPVTMAPTVHYGVTDAITVGVHHFRGLCLTGSRHGCPDVYEDLGIGALVRVLRGGGFEVAAGVALNAAPIDPFTSALELRTVARWTGGPFAFSLAPALSIGLDDRDSTALRTIPIAFPLASYSFGWVQDVTGNREILTVPATVQVQVIPPLAVVAGGALIAPIDPRDGALTDYATFPVGFAVMVTPGAFDVGASITFANTLGRERWPGSRPGEGRSARLWIAIRD